MARRVPPATAQSIQVPAPVGGVNSVAAGLALPPGDCTSAFNLVAAENGLRTRLGWREWCTGLSGDSDTIVRSLISFTGASSSRLWACTSSTIFDATEQTDTAASIVTFPSAVADAGYGVSTTVVTAGAHYVLYADEENGLYRYAEVGDSWTKVAMGTGAGEISGVDPARVCFVTVFAGRVWLVEKDTASAWYLPVGQIAGVATEFPMGLRFRNGGTLLGLYDWSYDGGSGMAAALVALTTGGDVLIYQGSDPSSADTWALKGVWYMGPPPGGRLIASSLGGDLLLITRQGVLPLSKLVVGIPDARAEALTYKVSPLLNALMGERGSFRGWSILQHPEDNTLIVLVPQGSAAEELQLVQSSGSKGWFLHRGLRMACAVVWERQLFYGTQDGRVCVNTGYVDNVPLAGDSFSAVDWGVLTAFSDLGTPFQKQVVLIRPLVRADGGEASYSVEARYRYDTSEVGPVTLEAGGSGTWDSAVWDSSVWGGEYAPIQRVAGATGLGTAVAIAMRGSAISRTVVVAWDVVYRQGGFL